MKPKKRKTSGTASRKVAAPRVRIDITVEDSAWNRVAEVKPLCRKAVRAALKAGGYKGGGTVALLLSDNKRLQELNHQFRGKNKPTNVLSFPAEGAHVGDIALSLQTLKKEAREQKKPLKNHLFHLVVHGALHLLGHDHMHEKEAEIMEKLEIEILASFRIRNPYTLAD